MKRTTLITLVCLALFLAFGAQAFAQTINIA